MKMPFLASTLGVFVAIMTGCAQQSPTNPPATSTNTPAASTNAVVAIPDKMTAPAAASPDFTDPSKLTATAPESFKVVFDTTKGKFTVAVTRSLAPNGADRFYNLVRSGFFKDVALFRVIPGFMCQFGIHGDPSVSAKWREANIPDDAVKGSNTRGAITFATRGPNTRTTQLFINFGNNTGLDGQGFAPFGQVTDGMDVVDKINSEYGEGAPQGAGPDQSRVQNEGNAYLKKDFPHLDYINSASLIP